jgi:hypothetical protein
MVISRSKELRQWAYLIVLGLCIAYIFTLVFVVPLPGEEIITALPAPPDTSLLDRAAYLDFCDLVSAHADYISSQSLDNIITFYRQHAQTSGWKEGIIGEAQDGGPYSDEWTQSAHAIVAAWHIPGEWRERTRIGIVSGANGDRNMVSMKTIYRLQVDYIQNIDRCQPRRLTP